MGNTELEKLMVEKFRINDVQAAMLGNKLNVYIKEFQERNIYQELSNYLRKELKDEMGVHGIGEENIKMISREYIRKNREWNGIEGYYSFLGYILTLIGQIACFFPSKKGAVITFFVSSIVFWILNKIAMKAVRKYMWMIEEFNTNFPGLICISIIACLGVNITEWSVCIKIIAVFLINSGLGSLYIIAKKMSIKRKGARI